MHRACSRVNLTPNSMKHVGRFARWYHHGYTRRCFKGEAPHLGGMGIVTAAREDR